MALGDNNLADLITRMNDHFKKLSEEFQLLNKRVNDLEVKIDNLRVQYDHHDHPYKPEPRYGGIYGG